MSFPDDPDKDCNVVFHPLQEKVEPDRMVTLAITVGEGRELPGMNLFYLHLTTGPESWTYPLVMTLMRLNNNYRYILVLIFIDSLDS